MKKVEKKLKICVELDRVYVYLFRAFVNDGRIIVMDGIKVVI